MWYIVSELFAETWHATGINLCSKHIAFCTTTYIPSANVARKDTNVACWTKKFESEIWILIENAENKNVRLRCKHIAFYTECPMFPQTTFQLKYGHWIVNGQCWIMEDEYWSVKTSNNSKQQCFKQKLEFWRDITPKAELPKISHWADLAFCAGFKREAIR